MESSDQFICFFCGSLSDEYGCPCSTCELCGNDAHYGYDCPSQVPFVYNQDPCFNQNLDNFPQTSLSFTQQYLCCEDCGGPHATFECQPMNHSTSSGFDQFQPPQYPVIHQPRQEMSTEMLLAKEKLIKAIRTCLKNNNQPPEEKSIAVLLAEKSILTVMQTLEEKQNDTESMQELLLQLSKDLQTLGNTSNQLKQEEQDSSQYWKPPVYYSDDDDDFYRESIDETPPSDAITPDLPITDSLVMEDEHLDTIQETHSDEEFESSVKNLNQNPSESEATSDNESECDLPIFDDSPLDVFKDNCVIFSRPLFDSYGDSTSSEYSSDNESFLEEDVFSNLPFEFDIESISSDVNLIYDEIDPLLEEFAGELALINPIPPGIARVDFDPEGDISLVDSDSLMKEIDIFLAADDSIPPGIDCDGYDSEEDNPFLENRNKTFDPGISIEVQSKRFLSLNRCSISFISDPLSPMLETLLPFSSEIEDKVFNPGILVSKEEKSPHLLSPQGFKVSKIIHNFLNEIPMMIYGGDMPILDVPYLHFYPL
ncbi:hypothetical protein Tco_0073940 [Tanacetum coccineum]